MVAEACGGLHAAHELTDAFGQPRNLVHRDISPQNVFITYSEKEAFANLSNYGYFLDIKVNDETIKITEAEPARERRC